MAKALVMWGLVVVGSWEVGSREGAGEVGGMMAYASTWGGAQRVVGVERGRGMSVSAWIGWVCCVQAVSWRTIPLPPR